MKPVPCFEVNKRLEEAAREAEARKNRAIERLTEKLGTPSDHCCGSAVRDLIDAGKHALKERGQ
ncbi:MAG TPA: hypothetical protein VK635_07770 [Bradyrhizobium sp.]|jgi:hypothetical protein|nr:hypothetical protein [Bradyrhizobium sp.]